MHRFHRTLLVASILAAAPLLHAKGPEDAIAKQLSTLRDVPVAQKPATIIKVATDIRALPSGKPKLKLADDLAGLATEGDNGAEALQAVADTLSQALTETPVPAKNDWPPPQYFHLARLVRYEGVKTTFADPLFVKAGATLAQNDADIEKVDFTLKDLNGKKVTLSQLRGKVVLVNFWATWCQPCRAEMGDLDAIYTHLNSQGLVVLSINIDEASTSDPFKVPTFVGLMNYHPPVLLDPAGKLVASKFHVDGAIPKSYVLNRDGKLVAEAIDMRTQRQFLNMIAQAGIQP
jgi:thiol-disulfide isomerase/thioredoxin